MHKSLLFFTALLLTSVLFYGEVVFAQNPDEKVNNSDITVDSIFNALTITDRMSQLLLIDARYQEIDFQNLSMEIGGILMPESTPRQHLDLVSQMRSQSMAPPLVFGEIGEKIGVEMDSIRNFGSLHIYENLGEPYLFYEAGNTLAKQCKILGISGLFKSDSPLFSVDDPNEYWRISEFNQGLEDEGILPMNAIKIIEFNDMSQVNLNLDKTPFLIKISLDEFPDFHQMMQEAMVNDTSLLKKLEAKIKLILSVKKDLVIEPIEPNRNINMLRRLNYDQINYEVGKATIRVINNPEDRIPIKELANRKIALISFGSRSNTFKEYTEKYVSIDFFKEQYNLSGESFADLWNKVINYDLIICDLHQASDIEFSDLVQFKIFLGWLDNAGKSIVASYINDKKLGLIQNMSMLDQTSFILSPDDSEIYHKLVPQLIFGGVGIESDLKAYGGRLNESIPIEPLGRFEYSYPEAVGLNRFVMNQIDSIAQMAIQQKATPGCQILVAKNNQVVYQKSFGYHTYDSLQKVNDSDLYDLASVTKVSGALPGLMKLYEEGKFDLDTTLGTYVKYFRRGNKKDLTFREILAHQSGLIPYISYWQTAIRKNGNYRWRTLSTQQSDRFPYEVADGLFLHRKYKNKIYRQIRKSKLGEKKYLYSGLTFLIFPEIIENISGQNYKEYLYENFYKHLGATTLTYNPLEKFDLDRIVPTEYDSLFRKSQIQGKVHDEAAAMMEGISSNAGLFANSNDLAKLWQMYCNYGEYGGRRYLKEETVKEFTRCQYPENDNRRALGFDRPLPEPHPDGNTAISASQLSFGHTGFTGIFAWADPEYSLVYIFLSNRVYPTRDNTKLYDLNIRTKIQQVIYDAMD